MAKKLRSMQLQRVFVLIAFSFLLVIGSVPALGQSFLQEAVLTLDRNPSKAQKPIKQILFKPPTDEEPPPTRGAGSRNDRLCSQDALASHSSASTQPLALTALVPPNQSNLTWVERPTVWVYVPETSARQIVLSVREESGQPHSQRFVEITGEAGIVGISMGEDAPPLEVGKVYQWAVVMICGDRPNPNDPFVTAWIRRAELTESLNDSLSALEKAAEYAKFGIWYDALTVLAEERRSRPTDPALAKIWADFLAQPSVGLEAIADEPLR